MSGMSAIGKRSGIADLLAVFFLPLAANLSASLLLKLVPGAETALRFNALCQGCLLLFAFVRYRQGGGGGAREKRRFPLFEFAGTLFLYLLLIFLLFPKRLCGCGPQLSDRAPKSRRRRRAGNADFLCALRRGRRGVFVPRHSGARSRGLFEAEVAYCLHRCASLRALPRQPHPGAPCVSAGPCLFPAESARRLTGLACSASLHQSPCPLCLDWKKQRKAGRMKQCVRCNPNQRRKA